MTPVDYESFAPIQQCPSNAAALQRHIQESFFSVPSTRASGPLTEIEKQGRVDPPISSTVANTLVFGSCNRQTLWQPVWPHISALRPQLFIWLGDIVYLDKPKFVRNHVIMLYLHDYQHTPPSIVLS